MVFGGFTWAFVRVIVWFGLSLRVRRLCTCYYLGMHGYLSLSFLLVVCLVVDLCWG